MNPRRNAPRETLSPAQNPCSRNIALLPAAQFFLHWDAHCIVTVRKRLREGHIIYRENVFSSISRSKNSQKTV
jgi:hypothetical protein